MSRIISAIFPFLALPLLATNVPLEKNDTADARTNSAQNSTDLLDARFTSDCSGGIETELELQILDRLMLSYNKQMLPGQKRVQAFIEITVNDITRVSELDSFFELDMFYSELWFDSRLSYQNWPEGRCVQNITLDLDYLGRLWTPNICIVNSKSAVIHSSPSENVFLIVYQDGKVWKNCRMILKAPCRIDLRAFPFDTQTCTLIFESYSFNSQRLTLQWFEETAITLSKSTQQLADFHLVDYRVDRSIVTYPNGQWDQLMATFVFERRYGFFIWQAFIPSYMTIFVAWITFFMDPKELATRATLGISAFLAIMLQFG